MKYAFLLLFVLAAFQATAQEEVPVISFAVSDTGTPLLRIDTDPEFYYVLFDTFNRARSLVRGEVGEAVLTESLAARSPEDYVVRRYPVSAPGDLDGDGLDDLTEFDAIPALSPFNPTPPLQLIDGASFVPDRVTFDSLAFFSEDPANNNPLPQREFLKIYVTDNDADSLRLYFMNTRNHEAHVEFANAIGIPTQSNGNSFFEDMRGILVLHPEITGPNGQTGTYTLQFQTFDEYPFALIERIFEKLGANMPFLEGNLTYLPLHRRALDQYNLQRDLYEDSRIPVLLEGDLYEAIDYLALNAREGYGRLRLMAPGERPNARDIVVYETIPNDLPRVGGIITTVIQTPLSHVNLRALQDDIPNAFIRGALQDEDFTALLGQNVYYRADPDDYVIRSATPQEIEDWYDALRPDSISHPAKDLTVTSITDLDDIVFEQAPAFGAKTSNVATMRDFGFPNYAVPDGFGIPLYFYDAYMRHNGFFDRAQELLANETFLNDFEIQDQLLDQFRDDIEDGEVPSWMYDELTALQQSFPEGTNIRCRSSTNNEDLPGFSGAGLYDSKTHKTTEGHISKTVKQVFAGLWTFRAFAEREFFRIDHLDVGMGILVHPNFNEERANGVGVTIDPVYETEETYYLNSQIGEDLVTNPEVFSLPEEILLDADGQGASGFELLRRSNLVPPGGQVLNVDYLDSLRTYMEIIHAEFEERYQAADNSDFGMDIEYKIDSVGRLVIKQARPWIGYLGDIDTSTERFGSSDLQLNTLPNPLNAASQIELKLTRPASVNLVVFDASGRPITRLANQLFPEGPHYLPLDASSWPAGAYFLRARVVYPTEVKYVTQKLVR